MLRHINMLLALAIVALASASGMSAGKNSTNHLWFHWRHAGFNRCGDVDAAPRLPAAIFEKSNQKVCERFPALSFPNAHRL